jgi:hypothetical protein
LQHLGKPLPWAFGGRYLELWKAIDDIPLLAYLRLAVKLEQNGQHVVFVLQGGGSRLHIQVGQHLLGGNDSPIGTDELANEGIAFFFQVGIGIPVAKQEAVDCLEKVHLRLFLSGLRLTGIALVGTPEGIAYPQVGNVEEPHPSRAAAAILLTAAPTALQSHQGQGNEDN